MTGKLISSPSATHIWRTSSRGLFGLRKTGAFFVLVTTVLLCGSYVLAAEPQQGDTPTPGQSARLAAKTAQRYRVFALRNISAAKAMRHLAEAGVGTVSKLPGANMLLVTDRPPELVKAAAILGIVDAKQDYAMTTVFTDLSAQAYPSSAQMADSLGDILVGTFSNPPIGVAKDKAIIDVHNGALVAIAPAKRIDQIVSAFRQPKTPDTPELGQVAEPKQAVDVNQMVQTPDGAIVESNKPEVVAASTEVAAAADQNEPVSDRLFDKLLESLARAEQKTAEARRPQPPAQPDQPKTVESVSVKPLPNELDPEPESKTVQPGDATLIAILEKLKALEAGLAAKSAPEPEPTKAELPKVPKIEKPNEPNHPEQPGEANEAAEPVSKDRPYDPGRLPNEDDVLTVNLPEKLPLIEFLSLVGKQLQLDILYDPKQVIGDVTLKVKGEFKGRVTVGELYQYLQHVLQFQGYVMTRSGNLVTVRPMIDVGTVDAPFVGTGLGKVQHGDVAITKDFKLQHIDTSTAETLLNSMQLGIKTASIPETGTLIITGFAYRMARIEELLNLVDKPGKPKKFKSRQLTYTMAESLAPKIKTLAEELGTISITISTAAAPPKQQTPARTTRRPGRTPGKDEKQPPSAGRRFTQRQQTQAGGPKAAKDTVYLEADARTNSILMIGHEEQLKIVGELINSLDVEQQDLRSLRLYEIVNVDAEEARGKLEELGIVSPSRTARGTGRMGRGTTRTGRGTAADRAAAAGGKAGTGTGTRAGRARGTGYTETEEAPVDEPQVVVIETVNALLVNATAEQHVRIAMIVGYVDLPTRAEDMPYIFYALENQDPVELAETLNKLIQETTQQKDKEGKIVQTSTQRRPEEDIVIIPDENTFGLIVYASKKNQQWIEIIIENLDKRRPQVLIDVTLVRIVKDDAFTFDLELLSSIPDMGLTSGQVVGVDSTIHDLLEDATDRGKFLDLKSSAGKFTGFYGDHKINALLTAVETKKYGRVMARPKLLVNDNEMGTIQTTSTTFVTRTTANVIPGSGTGGTVSTEQTVFEPYEAGITMEITPHISEGDMLRLEISLNRSDFTEDIAPEGGLTKPPNKADEDVTTIITVPDKSTIILGGMDKISHSKGGKKIPILGDLPLIGGLFREVVRSEGHDKLYIFVKAHILRPEGETALADLKDISKKNRAAFERLEQEMGEHQDWPGLKPTPMDPLRILEVD